ncbi:hypothetical protein GLOIN_2v1781605 [Rhizophagus clarus]|uniref:Uncharacterized protein n=1 Tax=Rhizophagus clarus TaxID=94130 RepID=A0A8H3MJ98_9GLOM|nr:hypothetical protein GLOIN_2v1781605 [Rhizophagus clarus]
MDLDNRTYFKLINAHNSYGGSAAYISILGARSIQENSKREPSNPFWEWIHYNSFSSNLLQNDKLASVSYDHDLNFMASYENYAQSKATVEKNIMLSAPKFESAYISVTLPRNGFT